VSLALPCDYGSGTADVGVPLGVISSSTVGGTVVTERRTYDDPTV